MVYFEKIQWSEFQLQSLRMTCGANTHFVQIHGSVDEKSDSQLIALVKKSLEDHINALLEHRILPKGSPAEAKLHHYIKTIAHSLNLQSSEAALYSHSLIQLAISEGNDVGSGLFDSAKEVYNRIVDRYKTFSWRYKILNFLQKERISYIEIFYWSKVAAKNTLSYGDFCNLYAEKLGLCSDQADHDEMITIPGWVKKVFECYVDEPVQESFFAEHTPSSIIRSAQANIYSSILSTAEMYTWWTQWVDRQAIEPQEKEAWKQEIAVHASLNGHPLQQKGGKVNQWVIIAMLMDIGVFDLPQI